MIEYQNLLGRQFEIGVCDCWSIAMEYYDQNYGIKLTNYARPLDMHTLGWSLYLKNLENEGFELLDIHPRQLQVSDFILLSIRTSEPHHGVIYVGEGKIIQHMQNRLSGVTSYSGIWRTATTNFYRHKLVKNNAVVPEMTLLEARKNVLGY